MQHIIRDIRDIVDRALTNRFKLLHQPLWRGSDLHAAHESRGIAWAEIGIEDFNRREITRLTVCALDVGLWNLDLRFFYDRNFARNTDVRQAVAAIRRHFDVQD